MNKTKVKGYVGIALIILMFVGFISWEMYFRENLMYEYVIAFKENVPKGHVVKEDDLHYINVEINSFKDAINNSNLIVDKVALVDIPANMPLSQSYFEESDLALIGDQYIFQVPNEWIYSFPQTLRAKDKIYFYEVKPGQVVSDGDLLIVDNNDIDQLEKKEKYELVESSTVLYVKDNSNKEVQNTGAEDSRDGSGNISSIEIVITPKQLNKLEKLAKNGSKFIILYRERD